jgi:penicillin-binding protein 1A
MSNPSNLSQEDISHYTKLFWKVIIYGILTFVLLIASVGFGLFGELPSFRDLENPKSNLATEVISSDGNILGTYFIQNRSNAKYKDLSPNLVNALIATEDVRFYKHSGVDLKGTFAIIFYSAIGKKRGSSTITQQLAKNLFPRKKQNIFNIGIIKLKEWLTAIKIERNYTKEEIITMYFNTVDFGSNSYGIKAAAKTYFSKTPNKLSIDESALLVGILKGTTVFSPIKNPERAIKRRNVVLEQMEKYGFISEAELTENNSKELNLQFQSPDHNQGSATYFREYVRQEVTAWCKENKKADGETYDIYRDGLKIYTTIDSRMQSYAEAAVKEHLTYLQAEFYKHWKGKTPWGENTDIILTSMRRSDRYQHLKEEGIAESEIKKIFDTPIKMTLFSWAGDIDTTLSPIDSIKYYKWYLRSSFMSMDPHNGAIKAWVGGPNYEYFKYDQVKMGKRQVGSTFKPFVYTVAMDNGWSPCYEAPNLPIVFEDFDNWSPKNSDGKQGGMMTLRNGLANSVNLITAFMMKQVGPQAVVNVAKKMGIASDIPAYPSICLGTADVSLYEMVGAYSTYANKGVWTEPVYISRIEDKNGNVLYEKIPRKVDALSEQTAYLMLYMLRGVIDKGTGLRLRGPRYRFTNPIAGKTGTTQENSDGWFIGITPDLVSGVWTGAEDRSVHFRSTNLGEGANTALPIWALYMKKVYADATIKISKGDFTPPAGGLDVEIDCDKFKKQSSGATNPSLDF